MTRRLIAPALSLLLLAGCAPTPRAGEVVMVASATEAHVTLPAPGIAVGDKVRIYRNVPDGARNPPHRKQFIADGRVTRLRGDKYAAVAVAPGVDIRMGDYAERP